MIMMILSMAKVLGKVQRVSGCQVDAIEEKVEGIPLLSSKAECSFIVEELMLGEGSPGDKVNNKRKLQHQKKHLIGCKRPAGLWKWRITPPDECCLTSAFHCCSRVDILPRDAGIRPPKWFRERLSNRRLLGVPWYFSAQRVSGQIRRYCSTESIVGQIQYQQMCEVCDPMWDMTLEFIVPNTQHSQILKISQIWGKLSRQSILSEIQKLNLATVGQGRWQLSCEFIGVNREDLH
eukprot:Gb_12939 [translate_table: standard]